MKHPCLSFQKVQVFRFLSCTPVCRLGHDIGIWQRFEGVPDQIGVGAAFSKKLLRPERIAFAFALSIDKVIFNCLLLNFINEKIP